MRYRQGSTRRGRPDPAGQMEPRYWHGHCFFTPSKLDDDGGLTMDTIWQDVRYATRSLLKTPGFTALAAMTLALGIGANTAMFSIVRGVLLEPLPYERPEEIVRVWPQRSLSKEMLAAFEGSTAFATLSGYHGVNLSLVESSQPEEVPGLAVVPGYFEVLGVRPALGRSFGPSDRQPGAAAVVVLSHDLWQRRFGADPDILGRRIALRGLGASTRTVIGVMAADFEPYARRGLQLWTPLVFDPGDAHDYCDMIFIRSLARLAPGVTREQARAEVRAIAGRLQAARPDYHSDSQVRTADVVPLQEILTRGVRPALWILLGAVGMVLLIGCSNIANMLLARVGGRQREMAVRSALGAGRTRLVRQLLTESALLGLLGGAAGLLAAVWAEAYLVHSLPARMPRPQAIGIGLQELAFTALMSALAALAFGLLPAWRATRPGLRMSLGDGGRRTSAGRRRHRLNQGLVVAEIALSVILVTGAGLMLRSLWHLQQVEPGFAAEEVWSLRLSPAAERYADGPLLSGYYRNAVERVEAEPGVLSAAAINLLPMTSANLGMGYSAGDRPDEHRMASVRSVTPGYFRSLGIPLLSGRPLADSDRDGSEEVGLVNETMARQIWPTQDAVGKAVRWDDGSPWFTVVGVVGDVHQHRLDTEPKPEVYRPLAQAFAEMLSPSMYLTVRTAGDAPALLPAIQAAIWSIDDAVPISNVVSMQQVVDSSLANARFFTLLLCVFGALALVLGGLGIYGVGAYAVSRRTREIGVRMALGARRRAMLRSVLARELAPVSLGILLGVTGALVTTKVLASSLFGVTATDPVTFIIVVAVLAAVSVAASYLPARRAARVDPIIALRSE